MSALFFTAYEIARLVTALFAVEFHSQQFELYVYLPFIVVGMFALRKYSYLYALIFFQSMVFSWLIQQNPDWMFPIRAVDAVISIAILGAITYKGYNLNKEILIPA